MASGGPKLTSDNKTCNKRSHNVLAFYKKPTYILCFSLEFSYVLRKIQVSNSQFFLIIDLDDA
jgi:hypothetical protein